VSTAVTEDKILEALMQVQDPELHQDLVSLGMIKDLAINGDQVSFAIELTTPACPLRDQIVREARQAVEALEGVSTVEVALRANVPSDRHIQASAQNQIKNAIAIASGKGGVGKTTVAVNIAVSLHESGARVGLLDADIYGPNVPTMMGTKHVPMVKDNKLIPAEAYGVRLMSIGFLVPPGQPLIWRGPMLHSAIRQFVNDVDWGNLDYLIVDLPPGTGDAQLSLAQTVPLSGGVIVTLPQKVSLEDARRGLEMFRTMEIPVLGIVENMSYLELPNGERIDVFGHGGGAKLARDTGVPLIGSVPLDPIVREAGDSGVPVVTSHPESPVSLAFRMIAKELAAKISVRALKGETSVRIETAD
jgi:ATP-binding protein involved in chromosome partitioning